MDKPQTRMEGQGQPRVIRVFVSGVFNDTKAERDYLHRFTFPLLSGLCTSRGLILKVVDLWEEIADENIAPEEVLRSTLEELQRSRPYYIGLIGKDYGRVVEPLPDELLNRWPLLAGFRGRSTNELEIVCGVLMDEAMSERGFFYFRDPKFTDVKAQKIRKKSGQSPHDAQKLDDLKQTIRDVSREGTCRLRENYRSSEELSEWIFDDFQQLINKLWPAPERQTEVRPYDDDVMFTVYRPETVIPQKWYSLLAFAHLSQKRPNAPADEPDPVAEVHRQAQQILGEKMDEYRESSQDSSSSVPQSGEITFQPFIKGFEFNPSTRSFRWEESVHREEFKMRATTAPDGEVAKGWLRVYLGPLILAQVNLSIKVDGKFVSLSRKQAPAVERGRPLQKVFASYSHKDRAIVEGIEEIVTHLRIEYLRDATKLHVGEVWNPRLMEMIREANVFQLFWSTNSMHSAFVRQEYEYALTLGRKDFILPIYWEDPFPEKPEDGLPPDELRSLQFAKLTKSIAVLARSSTRRRVRFASRSSPDLNVELSTVQSLPKADGSNELLTCSNCGRMGSRGHTYCPACGAKYSDSDSPVSYAGPSPVTMTAAPSQESTDLRAPSSAIRKRKKSNAGPVLVVLISAVTITAGLSLVVQYTFNTSTAEIATSSNANSIRRFETGGVEGSLRDLTGQPLVNTTVAIRNGPETKTDENGHFVFQDVPAGVQVIETQSPLNKRSTQSLVVAPNQMASVSLIYDSQASQLGLLSVTDPVDGALLKVDRVGNEFEKVIYGRCDGLKEILGQFHIWVLIRSEDDSRWWWLQPPAIIDLDPNTWQARVVFSDTRHSWSDGRRFDIVAVAARSESDVRRIFSARSLNALPPHVTSDVVKVTVDPELFQLREEEYIGPPSDNP